MELDLLSVASSPGTMASKDIGAYLLLFELNVNGELLSAWSPHHDFSWMDILPGKSTRDLMLIFYGAHCKILDFWVNSDGKTLNNNDYAWNNGNKLVNPSYSGLPQTPCIVSLLSESYNSHVRYGDAMTVGISNLGMGLSEAISLLEPLTLDVTDFVRQDALIAMAIAEVQKLSMEENRLDERIREMREKMRDMSEDKTSGGHNWQNKTLIAIEAPHGTTLEVPDLNEAIGYLQWRYRRILRSTMDTIDVYLVRTYCSTMVVKLGYIDLRVIPDPIRNLGGIKKTFQLHYNQKTSKGKLDFMIDHIMEISARNIDATERNTNPATPPNETQ
ncbi:transcription factor E2FA [Tanacetum coccineum]